jgi:hypothetical protein
LSWASRGDSLHDPVLAEPLRGTESTARHASRPRLDWEENHLGRHESSARGAIWRDPDRAEIRSCDVRQVLEVRYGQISIEQRIRSVRASHAPAERSGPIPAGQKIVAADASRVLEKRCGLIRIERSIRSAQRLERSRSGLTSIGERRVSTDTGRALGGRCDPSTIGQRFRSLPRFRRRGTFPCSCKDPGRVAVDLPRTRLRAPNPVDPRQRPRGSSRVVQSSASRIRQGCLGLGARGSVRGVRDSALADPCGLVAG